MKLRVKKFRDEPAGELLVLRDRLGLGRYRKTVERDEEEREILLALGLKTMEKREKDDFVPLGARRRKLRL